MSALVCAEHREAEQVGQCPGRQTAGHHRHGGTPRPPSPLPRMFLAMSP